MITLSKKEINKSKEWIIANGLGGYSSSTVINLNTRKYHGLLVSSFDSLNRKLMLSKIEETIHVGNKNYNLGINQYTNLFDPRGDKYLENFNFNVHPSFRYKIEDIEIIKSITMPRNYNAVVINYEIRTKKQFRITARPFVNNRSIHLLNKELRFLQSPNINTTVIRNANAAIILGSDKATYTPYEFEVYNVNYQEEKERGYEFIENHYSPGEFYFEARKGINKFNILCVGDYEKKALIDFDNLYSVNFKDYDKFFLDEDRRINNLIKQTHDFNKIKRDSLLNNLVNASDSFIVKDGIIAGYPWFGYYLRDALVSLPGLCLVTGRIEDAKKILLSASENIKNGLIPVLIDNNRNNYYGSADTSLWFIYSTYKFYEYTKNINFIRENLWDSVKSIIEYYKKGTDFGIKMDDDYLIECNSDIPLTWMDTKYTIRNGKNVEVNALWYNAVKIAEYLAYKLNEDNYKYIKLGENIKLSFKQKFWNGEYLYDNLNDSLEDNKITCNQVFAISLPFMTVSYDNGLKILKVLTEKLLTPYGLRSLNIEDNNYHGSYYGNQEERDSSYHTGTVWSYLLGFYITAYVRMHSDKMKAKKEAMEKIMIHVNNEMKNSGIGTISEIYDGDYPYVARGCISQAWGVAEIL